MSVMILFAASASMPQDGGGLSEPRVFHAAARLKDGRILVTGGRGPGGSASATADLFDSKTSKWVVAPAMPAGRWGHTSTALADGRVLAVGSKGAGCALFDPRAGAWTATSSLHTERYLHSATLLADGRVLVAGGRAAGTLASVEIWNPKTETWSRAPDMARARYYHTATLLADGRVLVAGGIEDRNLDGPPHDHCEVFDPQAHAWMPVGSLQTARLWHGAERLRDGRVLAVGGYRRGKLASCEIFDPRAGAWTRAPELREARYDMPTIRLADGRVMAVGGATGDSTPSLSSIEVYDPNAGTWSAGPSLRQARRTHTAWELPGDGGVLVVGGWRGWGREPLASVEILR